MWVLLDVLLDVPVLHPLRDRYQLVAYVCADKGQNVWT